MQDVNSYVPMVIHAVVVIAGLAAYATLSALGHDGTPVLAAALSYGTGAGAQAMIPAKQTTPGAG